MPKASCIYCGSVEDFGPKHGDHIIPIALGEFENDTLFKRVCRTCNSRIGQSEQHFLKCGPEGFFRDYIRIAVPPSRRRKHGRARVESVANLRGQHQLVSQSSSDPDSAYPADCFVICDSENQVLRTIPLFPNIRVAQVRKKLAGLDLTADMLVRLSCGKELWEQFIELARALWPDRQFLSLPDTEPGTQRVSVRNKFEFDQRYFQALAKIGFHYYLVHSKRGLRGDEPEFSGIREFILNGGEPSAFVSDKPKRFHMPFRQLSNGLSLAPHQWCHMLAADERKDRAVAYVGLFSGPKIVCRGVEIAIGKLSSQIEVESFAFGHFYIYHSKQPEVGFAGKVRPMKWTTARRSNGLWLFN